MADITAFPIVTKVAAKADVGLSNVDNTADAAKPISTLTQAALDTKRAASVKILPTDIDFSAATTGQILKFDGTVVGWGTDNTGGGGGGGAVNTVFGRSGDVVPQSGDYSFAQIGTKPTTLSGYGISDGLPSSHAGTGGTAHANATTGSAGFLSTTDKVKLDGIAAGATANSADATLLNRSNHTGAQATSTVTGLDAALALLAPIANPTFTGTVAGITKSMVGLASVDNTSDVGKPVSTAQATAISLKHTNIQFQNASTNLGATGTVDTLNTAGTLSAGRSGNIVTLTGTGAPLGALVDVVSTTTYTFVTGDKGRSKYFTNASGCSATVPASLGTDFQCGLQKSSSAGSLTIVQSGTTMLNESGSLVMSATNGAGAILATPTADVYTLAGPFGTAASGTVTTASVVTANGFAGTVATATSTPAITLTTSVTGVLKGNGTAISAATAGTDYYAPSGTDVAVADGGTGVSTLTAYAPVFGGTTGTGAVQSGTVGTTGQVLTSNGAGALPTFQAAAGGSSAVTVEDVTTTTYTFVAGDQGKVKRFTNASGCTATIPASLGTGWNCLWERSAAAGSLTFAASSTTIIAANGSGSLVASVGLAGSVVYEAADTYKIAGLLGTTGTGDVTLTGSQTLTNKTLTSPVINTAVTGSAVATAATASTLAKRDANGALTNNSHIDGYTTTATAAGTTTLTVASTQLQYFTGSTTQTVVLPVTSTLVLGQRYNVKNASTGAVTVQSSGANTISTIAAGGSATFTVILTSGTTAASWDSIVSGTGTGDMLLGTTQTKTAALTFNSATLILAGSTSGTSTVNAAAIAGSTTMTLPGATTTLAGLAVEQNYTKAQAVTEVALTDAATVAIDASLSNTFYLAIAGNRTLGLPTNPKSGQTIRIVVKQDATGSRTLAYNAAFKHEGGTAPVLSTAANAIDVLSYTYNLTNTIWIGGMAIKGAA